ncbi:alpha-L-fucosidase [Streptomyces sp. NPDC001107]
MGAKYTVLTTRHHEGFAQWPSTHPNAFHAGQTPMRRDLVGEYVTAVRDAGPPPRTVLRSSRRPLPAAPTRTGSASATVRRPPPARPDLGTAR